MFHCLFYYFLIRKKENRLTSMLHDKLVFVTIVRHHRIEMCTVNVYWESTNARNTRLDEKKNRKVTYTREMMAV